MIKLIKAWLKTIDVALTDYLSQLESEKIFDAYAEPRHKVFITDRQIRMITYLCNNNIHNVDEIKKRLVND